MGKHVRNFIALSSSKTYQSKSKYFGRTPCLGTRWCGKDRKSVGDLSAKDHPAKNRSANISHQGQEKVSTSSQKPPLKTPRIFQYQLALVKVEPGPRILDRATDQVTLRSVLFSQVMQEHACGNVIFIFFMCLTVSSSLSFP